MGLGRVGDWSNHVISWQSSMLHGSTTKDENLPVLGELVEPLAPRRVGAQGERDFRDKSMAMLLRSPIGGQADQVRFQVTN